MKKIILFFVFCILFSVFFVSAQSAEKHPAGAPRPLWGDLGMIINNTPGKTPHENPKIISTSDGNLALIWEDGRNGYTNIYAQKIDGAGNRLWSETAVQVCSSPDNKGNQNNPAAIDDGAGGLIVTWQSYCNGTSDIFAQRISAAGQVLWSTEGAIICDAPAGHFAPELVSDGAGGAIITWYDYRGGAGEDIYAQRIESNGSVLWEKNGIPICTAPGTQWYPKIAGDGAGGAIIAWSDGRSSASDNNIFAQRVDPNGKILWAKDGVPVCTAPQNQEKPVIASVDNGALIAWQDSRAGRPNIYAQKIDLSGQSLWTKDGVAVSASPYSQQEPQISADGKGGVVIAWTDLREEASNIYAQKISSDGRLEWGESGRQVAGAEGKQENPKLVHLKTADWLIVWADYRNNTPLIFGQKINSSGISLWPASGLPLSPAGKTEEKPAAALTPDGQVMTAWQDKRDGDYDIYVQKISGAGLLAFGDEGAVISNTPGAVVHQNPALADDGKGNIILVWEDARSGFINIYAQKISRQGTLLWGKNAIPLAKVKADQSNPQLVTDGAGGALVAWEDKREPNNTRIYAQRISAGGQKIWAGGSRALTEIVSRQTVPVMVSDGAGGAIIVWQDERDPLSLKDLYGQRLSAGGEPLWDKNGALICGENGDQVEQAMISDGAGGAILAWTDYRKGERNPDIYAQSVNSTGNLLWPKEGLLVCGAPDVQKSPTLARDKENGVIIAWTDRGSGNYDIYAQRVSKEGKTLWLTDGIPICQTPRTQQNPMISSRQTIIWEDYRYGNWDIFANSVSLQGKLLWGEDGAPVVVMPQTQYAPQIIAWKEMGDVVAWEDYRSGKQYEIYLQMIDGAGKPVWQENGLLVKSTDGARAPKLLALPKQNAFVVVYEDYTGGGKALSGQLYSMD